MSGLATVPKMWMDWGPFFRSLLDIVSCCCHFIDISGTRGGIDSEKRCSLSIAPTNERGFIPSISSGRRDQFRGSFPPFFIRSWPDAGLLRVRKARAGPGKWPTDSFFFSLYRRVSNDVLLPFVAARVTTILSFLLSPYRLRTTLVLYVAVYLIASAAFRALLPDFWGSILWEERGGGHLMQKLFAVSDTFPLLVSPRNVPPSSREMEKPRDVSLFPSVFGEINLGDVRGWPRKDAAGVTILF